MQRKTIGIAACLVSLVAVSGLGGCATTSEIKALRLEVREANMTARRAREEALAASQMAGKARAEAEQAKAMVEANDARLDKMSK